MMVLQRHQHDDDGGTAIDSITIFSSSNRWTVGAYQRISMIWQCSLLGCDVACRGWSW